MSAGDFLDEVQYLASLPERLRLLDEDLQQRLAGGFAKHPWVDRVLEVKITPPRQIEVHCQYRRPVLAVRFQGAMRAVDSHGVLLPRDAPTAGLSRFSGEVSPPRGPAGTAWGDARIETAAGKAMR
jgi:hypothetical protein